MLPARISKQVGDFDQLEARDVLDIALADFRLGVISVLVEDVVKVPARYLAYNTHDTAGSMLGSLADAHCAAYNVCLLTLPWLQCIKSG